MKKILLVILVAIPLISGSQELDYTPLAPIPQITGGKGDTTVKVSEFVPRAITLGIGIAGALAVIFIMIGGVKYITTDAYGEKGDAKKTIEAAVFGLLLAIGSYAILFTIDKDLVKFDLDIAGVQQGGAIDPNSVNTSTGTRTYGNQSAIDVGCTNNCIALLEQVPNKGPHSACDTDICYLNARLIDALKQVNEDMGDTKWQVTEAYPPTVRHKDRCHMDARTNLAGTCADIGLKDIDINSETSVPTIAKFLRAIDNQDLIFQYEVKSRERYDTLIKNSILRGYASRIRINNDATGEHAHVELPL